MKRRSMVWVALLLMLFTVAAWNGWRLVTIHRWNAAIGLGLARIEPHAPAEVRFAAAYALAARGKSQAALNAYRELDAVGDTRLRRDAKFNSATLYLQEAEAARSGANPTAALTWVELAKQSYRELLREDSGDWDARYNLERALRLAPDPEGQPDDLPPPPDSRHTPSSATGISLGLP